MREPRAETQGAAPLVRGSLRIVEQFRMAVASGEYHRAQELWNAYAAERLMEVCRGSGEHLPEMRELIEWARRVTLCARAQGLRSLRLRLAEGYAAETYAASAGRQARSNAPAAPDAY